MSNVNTGLGVAHDNAMNHHIDNKTQLTLTNTKLENLSGAGNNNIGEGASKLQTYVYGRDATNGLMKPLKLDTSGRLECSVDALEVTAETINLSTDTLEALITATNSKITIVDAVLDASLVKQTNIETLITTLDGVQDSALTKLGEIETSANALISANHTDLVALETSLTSMEAKQNTQITHLSEIEGAVETLEGCVGSNKVNVNISSGNISGFSTATNQSTIIGHVDGIETLITATNSKIDTFDAVLDASLVKQTNIETLITTLDGVQDNALTKLGEIETSANALISANHTDLVALETSLTSMEGKQDTQVTHLSEIEGAVETLEACVGSNKVNVNISSGNISGFSTATNQSTIIGHVDGIETLITATNSAIGTFDAVLDASLVKQTNIETLITTLDGVQDSALTKLGEIETSANALISANHTDLVALESSLTSMEGKQDTQITHLSEIEGAVETLEACVGSNKVNVNISSGNISGFSTATKQDTIIGHVDGIETLITATNSAIGTFDAVLDASLAKQTNIETLITSQNALISTLDGVQDSALTKLGEIDTAIDTLDAVVDAVLVKLTPIKTHTIAISGAQDAGAIVFSSAIDVRTIKHFDVIGTDTNLVDATISVVGSITSGGTYIPIASSPMSGGALTGSLRFNNSAFKFIKVKLLVGGSASSYTIIVYMSS